MRRILLIIPVSAALIAVLVAFKLTRRYEPPADESANDARPAPLFQLYDEHSQIVRLARYIGRHKLLIVFFDGRQGPDHNPLVAHLRDKFAELHATGAIALAISAARPSENRYGTNLERRGAAATPPADSELRYPFPLLSDILDYEVHRKYGAFDFQAQEPLEAIFVVDRAGMIQHVHLGPGELGSVDDWVRELRDAR
jgi:peroxiredoxin